MSNPSSSFSSVSGTNNYPYDNKTISNIAHCRCQQTSHCSLDANGKCSCGPNCKCDHDCSCKK